MISMRGRRRRVAVMVSCIMFGVYIGIAVLTYMIDIAALQEGGSDISGDRIQGRHQEYTLPSLDEVIKSVDDLDLQHVLNVYRKQYDQVPEGTPPVRVIVSSTWRSGSTLLAEILSSHPGVYYHYEPLMSYGLKQISQGPLQTEVVSLLRSLLKCNYSKQEEYLKFAFVNHDLFVRNTGLWTMCSSMPRTKCYNPDNLNKLCSLFPVHVMKVVRTRLSILAELLDDPNSKLIWLVRDPRATMTSRTSSVTWCDTKACKDPGYLCSDLQEDYNTYIYLKEERPNQVMLVRYEDLAKDPYSKSKEILEFVGLKLESPVKAYLDDHLHSDVDAPWSTRHDPRKVLGKWMKVMSWKDVVKCQFHCRTVMKYLGYRTFQSEKDLESGNAVGMLNIP